MMYARKMRDQANLPRSQLTAIPGDLGEFIARDIQLARYLSW